ncbi:MAG: T9SS type A sorting domain-containing protein [Salibacteraceae bacterium]
MKITYIFSPIILGVGSLLWMSASGGVADVQNKDRTGSPVSDVNCTQCHASGANFSTAALMQLTGPSGSPVSEYLPGEKYSLLVNIQSTGSNSHGFQVTGLLGDNSKAGTCVAQSTNTQITPLNGKWYFEPTDVVMGGSYEMEWTAPSSGSGTVTFYGSALTVNGNGTTVGDEYVNIPNLVIPEGIPNGVAELNNFFEINAYPNPVTSVITVSTNSPMNGVEVIDISGKTVYSEPSTGVKKTFDIGGFVNGIYLLKVTTTEGLVTTRIVKE